MNILIGIVYGVLGQILSYVALQGSYKYKFIQDNEWLIALSGIPTTWLFYKSVQNFVSAFNGEMWPSRLIGFSIGAVIFSLMSYAIYRESLTPKTLVCLALALLIVLIQVYWKN